MSKEEIERLKADLSTARQSLYKVVEKRNTLLAEVSRKNAALQVCERLADKIINSADSTPYDDDLGAILGAATNGLMAAASTLPCPDIGKDGHNHPANPCPKCSGTGEIRD